MIDFENDVITRRVLDVQDWGSSGNLSPKILKIFSTSAYQRQNFRS